MKKLNFVFAYFLVLGIIFSSCGGASMVDNTYLGQLPSISKKYLDQQDELKEKAKKATDMNDAFKYDKEYKLAKEEGNTAIDDYLANNKLDTPIPFDANADYRFDISDLMVDGASLSRVNLKATATMKEDVKNKYGGFEKYIFAYMKAVDIEGNILGKATVMASPLGGKHEAFKEGVTAEIKGSIGNIREFESFDRIVFISKGEYEEIK